jgi:hypothetical protein
VLAEPELGQAQDAQGIGTVQHAITPLLGDVVAS